VLAYDVPLVPFFASSRLTPERMIHGYHLYLVPSVQTAVEKYVLSSKKYVLASKK
jgi:hypothetical protein